MRSLRNHVARVASLSLLWGVVAVPAFADGTIDYERDIAPIFEDNCIFCHDDFEAESGFRVDLRSSLLKGGDYGLPAVVPGHPEQSYLLEVITHSDPGMEMPPDSEKIPADQIELIRRWIAEGAVVPGQMDAIVDEGTDHWSFQPVVRPDVPVGTRRSNPVDAFLAARLESEGLDFSPEAEPRDLIRRLSIVLTGLPPGPDEADRFVAAFAGSPEETYARAVDKLLESPHFGERWAQHWLDVIRWAETNGSESNLYRKNAWIYRDYVIRAFNEDKPYDRFLFEQIAGDTVGQGDATGYLVAGPHVPVATVGQVPSARRQARADRMDEVLQTVGASTLGMTIGCARCHNHKFDPISIGDYYSISAVFQGVEFGSRYPELDPAHPRRLRGQELYREIASIHGELRETGPWEEDWIGYRELHIKPTVTDSVRVSFTWDGASIDELEAFGPEERNRNLAAASADAVVFSPRKFEKPRGEVRKINDGRYGTEAWRARAADGEKPWVQVTFPAPVEVERFRLSSNRNEYLTTDYISGMGKYGFGPYFVEVRRPDGSWEVVADTRKIARRDKADPERVGLVSRLSGLIAAVTEEGPKPSFVGRFVQPTTTHIFNRGSPEDPRAEVFPAGLSELGGEFGLGSDASNRERRVAFAEWLTDEARPLTSRVIANRLWHHVFGQGIVATPADFGSAGAPPTHPELLDWLAAELVEPTDGRGVPWSLKRMLRLLVHSHAFRQSSRPREPGVTADRNATLLWRFPPKRVEAEVIRDSVLTASGVLDDEIGGRSYRIHNVKKRYSQWAVTDNFGPETWRRMIYQERMRRVDDELFTAFDFPDCGQVRPKRPVSTTPLQALNLLNSPFVIDQSNRIAGRAFEETDGSIGEATGRAFRLILGREPTSPELADCVAVADERGLPIVCRALINSNEFAFLQ